MLVARALMRVSTHRMYSSGSSGGGGGGGSSHHSAASLFAEAAQAYHGPSTLADLSAPPGKSITELLCSAFRSLPESSGDTAEASEKLQFLLDFQRSASTTGWHNHWFHAAAATPEGFRTIIQLRADTAAFSKDHTELQPLHAALTQSLRLWMRSEWLRLEEVRPESSPEAVLSIVQQGDQVRPMADREDLLRRLTPASHMRIYALTHMLLPDVPLVFIEACLSRQPAASIAAILESPERDLPVPDTSVFYSINSTQRGLAGIEIGPGLIYRVATALSREGIRNFYTLSPLPGFRRWLQAQGDAEERQGSSLVPSEIARHHGYACLRELIAGLEEWVMAKNATRQPEDAAKALVIHYIVVEHRMGRTR
eukprot:NODE_661_length_2002_cov_22.756784_g611_i0.p1 GENE.NODE_661_length_2002_cov_22.756784_g611_i0~~NODE_661_length_2002_cov_22.756784_g611_i0.p1  ORF type:complete len:368 (-),score=51.97 NODE_661_length_2002_cov_22.756784_g611_i0:824-1927(-)